MLDIIIHDALVVPNLVYSARGSEVEMVIVDGKVILEGGKLLTLDEQEITKNAKESARLLAERA
ncbi:hypothetical protein [Thermovenabulum sp.]